MRTAIVILALLVAATGCITNEPVESETTSDLTLVYTSPTLLITARIARARSSATDLRALAAATKPPVNPTWTVYQQYRSFTKFLNDSATELDAQADLSYEQLMAARTEDEKDSINEMGQQDMLMLQQAMEQKNKLEYMVSSAMASASAVAQKLIDTLKA